LYKDPEMQATKAILQIGFDLQLKAVMQLGRQNVIVKRQNHK